MLDPQRIVLHCDGALAGVRAQVAFEAHPLAIIGRGINDRVGAIVVVRVDVRRSLAAEDQNVVLGLGAEMEPACQPGRETKSSRPACREANNQDLVGLRDEHLTGVDHVVDRVAHTGDAAIKIRHAAIVANLGRTGRAWDVECQHQITHGQTGLGVWAHHLLAQMVGLGILPLEDQAADLRQGLECLWVVTVLGSTRPERVLVEADPLGRHTAVNHAAQAAVAHRHRLEPFSGWPRMPKAQELVRRIGPTGENRIGGLNPGRHQ